MNTLKATLRVVAMLGAGLLLAACEKPPIDTVQRGVRGTGMVQVYNPRTVEAQIPANQPPADQPAIPVTEGSPKAADVYQNVKVLGSLDVGNFTRLMVAMTSWVSPEAGCNYCHSDNGNFAEDSKYTKVVARRMLQMTQDINANWKSHVAETGVTCYTCHRGQPVPNNVWFTADAQPYGSNFMGDKAGQNSPTVDVKLGSLPYDPLTSYLGGKEAIRVGGTTALPQGKGASIQQTEKTYALMTHMSSALGQNCTFCHNTQNFSKWENTPPQRVTAWHGIQMARDLNLAYMEPLATVFPANRKGELGDVAKMNCATCHQGVNKPLAGVPMLKDHPELAAYRPYTAPAPAPAEAAPNAPSGPSQ